MLAIKTTVMKEMPSGCDTCVWFGCRPHPYKGWTDLCELMMHCLDDDQPDEWSFDGDTRPKACPLIYIDSFENTDNNSCSIFEENFSWNRKY